MTTEITDLDSRGTTEHRPSLDRAERKTLEAIFHHPLAHNLKWSDAIALFESVGNVEHKANNEFTFLLGAERHTMRGPHTKDMTGPEVVALREFLVRSGWSGDGAPLRQLSPAAAAAPNLLVVLDHHEGKIYEVEASLPDASPLTVKPYDPHHFQRHLAHKDQSRERGQRTHEDLSFYERLSAGLANAGKIVVMGHGKGHSNAAHYLTDYLRTHHNQTYQRVVREIEVDLSSTTLPQLLAMARDVL